MVTELDLQLSPRPLTADEVRLATIREAVDAMVGRNVRVSYFKGPREKNPLPPVDGVVVATYTHGFLIQGAHREFLSYTDLFSRRAHIEVVR